MLIIDARIKTETVDSKLNIFRFRPSRIWLGNKLTTAFYPKTLIINKIFPFFLSVSKIILIQISGH